MLLKAGADYVELLVLTKKTAGTEDFWEENWLYTSVTGSVPGFRINFNCYLRTDDLKRWYSEVLNIENGDKDEAHLLSLEEPITMIFTKKSSGNIDFNGIFTATELTGCSLKFAVEIEMSSLSSFAKDIRSVLEEYPIIGEP